MQLEFLSPELLVIVAVGAVAIVISLALALYVAAHLVGVERASPARSLVVTVVGLLLLGIMIAATLGLTGTTPFDPATLLSRPQLFIVYAVIWILLVKLGFESSFLDAITVGAVSLILGVIAVSLILLMITILQRIFIPV